MSNELIYDCARILRPICIYFCNLKSHYVLYFVRNEENEHFSLATLFFFLLQIKDRKKALFPTCANLHTKGEA